MNARKRNLALLEAQSGHIYSMGTIQIKILNKNPENVPLLLTVERRLVELDL